jgi:hypothetical protein
MNEIPLVFSMKNKDLIQRLKQYRDLFKIRENLHENSTKASSNESLDTNSYKATS